VNLVVFVFVISTRKQSKEKVENKSTHLGENTSFTVEYKGERIQTGKDNDNDHIRLDLKGLYWGLNFNF